LKRDHLGVGDNFFALGGHSLLASQVISRIRDGFGVEVPLSQIFETPTISSLAAIVEGLLRTSPSNPVMADLRFEGERSRLTTSIDRLSEDEIDALMLELKNGSTTSARRGSML
jgi:hypothetical protein